jgi:GTP-binding protein
MPVKNYQFKNPLFIKSAKLKEDYPVLKDPRGEILVEIAVLGRSNVGKSTLLNSLFQRKGLVKTSSTPGKTQLINFFTLNQELAFVDLPGYGYAKIAKDEKENWHEMIVTYLREREPLKLLLLLLDIRREPSEYDIKMLEWVRLLDLPTILVLTKVDKLNLSEKITQTKKILNSFDRDLPHVCCSAIKNEGRLELIAAIKENLNG